MHVPSTEINSDSILAEGYLSGDREGFAELFRIYAPSLCGYLRRMVGDNDVADQLLQETFVAIWNDRVAFAQSKQTLFVWMLQKAKTVALSAGRRNISMIRNQAATFSVDSFQVGTVATDSVVDSPPIDGEPLAKLVFELIHLQGYSPLDVANCLNITSADVKILLRSAMNRIKSVRV